MPELDHEKRILVTVCPELRARLNNNNLNFNQEGTINFSVRLEDLIYATGTIQTRRFRPTERQKISDFDDLLEHISEETDFRINISAIQQNFGPDIVGNISEDLGVGLSAVVVDKLFGIDTTTISKITDNKLRPDYQCFTRDGVHIVVESKGSTSTSYLNSCRSHSILQKGAHEADIHVVSLTCLKENDISNMEVIDPIPRISHIPPDQRRNFLRCIHYSGVFSFIGERRLSNYFSKMAKRLIFGLTTAEQDEKDSLIHKIKKDYRELSFENHSYLGTLVKNSAEKFEYIGVDTRLLTFPDFFHFEESTQVRFFRFNDSRFFIFRDGIVRGIITEGRNFPDNFFSGEIKNIFDYVSISDIDEMMPFTFEKAFLHVLRRCGFVNLQSLQKSKDSGCDCMGFFKQKLVGFQFKIFRNVYNRIPTLIPKLDFGHLGSPFQGIIIVTNGYVDQNTPLNSRVRIWDRAFLSRVLKDLKQQKIIQIDEA